MKNVIIESHVPFIPDHIFRGLANVQRLDPEAIDAEAVSHADALIIRTRTRCDASLLQGSHVTFIGTATIGTDHIDLPYCASRGIRVVNAPGCNAPAVAQYVLCSILALRGSLRGITLGIVGVGHVGSLLNRWAKALGMNTLLCDPPRARREGSAQFCSLAQIASQADVITFHTPLTRTGPDATYHLADAQLLASLRPGALIINSSRGPVVDNHALLHALCDNSSPLQAVIDTWENEPRISVPLLRHVSIATPHIAGYSLAGKQRATQTVVNALLDFLAPNPATPSELSESSKPSESSEFSEPSESPPLDLGVADPPAAVTIPQLRISYSPLSDTLRLKEALDNPDSLPRLFENLRNSYPLRQEP